MERPTTPIPASPRPSPVAAAAPPPPTIFVQAEPHTFRDLVQKHTGAPPADKLPVAAPPARSAVGPRRPAFKLQERRPSVRKLEIKLGLTSLHQAQPSPRSPQAPPTPRQQYLLLAAAGAPAASFPSPVTPLWAAPLFSPAASDEDRAIAEKGFYLHPSPRGGSDPPELLPLFPLASLRQADDGEQNQSKNQNQRQRGEDGRPDSATPWADA
ncbi:unnamed protein product [Spirodela intermedia]|uniref:VQ domain-containing protein n=1 Tax=Spirodela intermedia TaxID=51605 RepID=A0A7I8LDM1_SPIIN|nr:unnamed protein product [Spirodela intermedia]